MSSDQVALVEEAIAFLSPQLYSNPGDPELRKQEEQLKRKLECSLGRDRVMLAFSDLVPNPQPTLADRIDAWLSWFTDCVVK